MSYLLNLLYLFALVALSPWLLYKALTTGKYRRGLGSKLLGLAPPAPARNPVWFHGVSVGEIHLLRSVVARFRERHPDQPCVISTTTDTGFDEARKHFADLPVFWWPFDFSWAVRRALRRVRPSLVVLAEGEIWPNFVRAAARQGVPIAVINGRMSPRSLSRYRRLRALVRPLFAHVNLFAVQTEDYAAGFRHLGAAPERVHVTGSVKYDGVEGNRHNPDTMKLRRLLNVAEGDLIWVVGSTQEPEEEVALDIYRRARVEFPRLRLFLVPRQKDRFDAVAELLRRSGQAFVRRSQLTGPITDRAAVVLLDTIGELGALWGLADVAFVGGSLDGRRGGQNMIEPAAYGAAVVFGPHVWNFRDTVTRLLEAGAALQAKDAAEVEVVLHRLFADGGAREQLGSAARSLVRRQQGATQRTLELLTELLPARTPLAA